MQFGDLEILSGVDLCANAGEIVGLMGANGVGNSTLLRVCAGLLLPFRSRKRRGEVPRGARVRILEVQRDAETTQSSGLKLDREVP